MAFAGWQRLGSEIRNKIWGTLLEEHKLNVKGNQIVCLRFPTGKEDGDSELQVYKPNLLPITFSICRESRAYTLEHYPNPVLAGQGTVGQRKDIIFFDYKTLKKLELHQTGPLQRAANSKTVAVDWRSFQTHEKLKEALMTIYSRLRNIKRIAITVDYRTRCYEEGNVCHRHMPLGIFKLSRYTLLGYEDALVNWSDLAREIQRLVRDQSFWRECNRKYALEQILPINMNPPRIPRICRLQIFRSCEHDKEIILPEQNSEWMWNLAPSEAEIKALRHPEQLEDPIFVAYEEEGKEGVYSLKELLN
ncbi:hypothetical protein HD806DRAFT_419614 [Xylariaceae sp. AK1471]|nr:hypothetical protein HD806DRAFT_419614 [Xylariaceae sp. AK1471]